MKRRLVPLIALIVLVGLAGCAAGPNRLADTPDGDGNVAGFFRGLWHGFIVLLTFIISLFSDRVHFYEVHNSGWPYDLGFILGVMIFFGGSGGGACKQAGGRKNG